MWLIEMNAGFQKIRKHRAHMPATFKTLGQKSCGSWVTIINARFASRAGGLCSRLDEALQWAITESPYPHSGSASRLSGCSPSFSVLRYL